MMRCRHIHLAAALLLQFAAAAAAQPADFWADWGDGRAEISSYRTEVPRYGEQRRGWDVLVFVTEDLSADTQVKVDRPLPPGLKVPVLKLNHVRRFTTGIYDYSVMRSTFCPLAAWGPQTEFPALRPVKVSLIVSEWCGNYYVQLNSRPAGFRLTAHSYFDGEADSERTLPHVSGGLLEDDLLVRVRELVQPFPSGAYQMLTSVLYARFVKEPLHWVSAVVERQPAVVRRSTELGALPARDFIVKLPEREYRITVEAEGAKRILAWTHSAQGGDSIERAEILASMRAPYWRQQSLGDEALREALKLPRQ